jgi:hypothetical protein
VSHENLEEPTGSETSATGTVMAPDSDADPAEQLEYLTEENQRLRREYEQSLARTDASRRNTLALGGLLLASVGALAGSFLYPAEQTLLLALGGAGLFVGLLTVALRPGRSGLDESVFGVVSRNYAALAAEFDLQDLHVYVPSETDPPGFLFVPRRTDFVLPSGDDPVPLFVESASDPASGLALSPTGAPLFRRFEAMQDGTVPTDAAQLAGQLCEALEDGFELAGTAHPVVDAFEGRTTVTFEETAYGPVDRFDHPVRSFVGVGLAVGLGAAVTVESVSRADDDGGFDVVYRWDGEREPEDVGSSTGED